MTRARRGAPANEKVAAMTIHKELRVYGGRIEVQRPGRCRKAIRLIIVTPWGGTPVKVWLPAKQQVALRVAIRAVQSKGAHRWP